jgi:hypothetical protein
MTVMSTLERLNEVRLRDEGLQLPRQMRFIIRHFIRRAQDAEFDRQAQICSRDQSVSSVDREQLVASAKSFNRR